VISKNRFLLRVKFLTNWKLIDHFSGHQLSLYVGRFKMEKNTNKAHHAHEDTKKLSFVIVFLSLLVIVLFGLAPIA